jgi:hypothetical protein
MFRHLVAPSRLIVVIAIVTLSMVMSAVAAVAASHAGAMHPDEESEQHNPKPIGL